ncbi:anhydro-N-acetylmuramic acid kinase [Saprospira grandis]|uniref:anhydro-N-acetylmuramic acid kinase n=1 Tax=Saprospira grandis TaxID=1008 RepID=UPI0022DD2DE1|nr:anhydro-N-acetylmuramic acid kinase [Saprospira grandis]WBM73988.1 anhydro-N-acetylmuramic acid kinase [Saprospira grandis]
MSSKNYYILGLMSGSSLDGLDLAYCRMQWGQNGLENWELLAAQSLPYSNSWEDRLRALPQQSALIYAKTDQYFGFYMAELVQQFLAQNNIRRLDFIASHGHTVFHEPDKRFGAQIGRGSALAALTKRPVISDFRSQDLSLSGEGAPLAPIADAYLFPGYNYYLNLGGIANLSAKAGQNWRAFDFAPANQLLNFLAQEKGASYDKGGQWASQGEVQEELLATLLSDPFYQQTYPKSLSNAWVQGPQLRILAEFEASTEDKLATVCELIGISLRQSILDLQKEEGFGQAGKLLVSGGGAFNHYLLGQLQAYVEDLGIEIFLPDNNIIEFKEALLMALLGLLRWEKQTNAWPQVTGAKKASINGGIHWPPPKS